MIILCSHYNQYHVHSILMKNRPLSKKQTSQIHAFELTTALPRFNSIYAPYNRDTMQSIEKDLTEICDLVRECPATHVDCFAKLILSQIKQRIIYGQQTKYPSKHIFQQYPDIFSFVLRPYLLFLPPS